jgi:hypothetical protein
MADNNTPELFKLNVLGLFTIQAPIKKITIAQIILIMAIIMVFIIIIIWLLKVYAIPALSGTATIGQVKGAISNMIKSRSP